MSYGLSGEFSEVRYQLLQLQSSLSVKPTLRVVWQDLRFSSSQDQAKYPSQRLPKKFHNLGNIWHECGGRGVGAGYKWIKVIWSIQLRTITSPWQASSTHSKLSSHLIPGLKVFLKVKSLGRPRIIHKNSLHVIPQQQIYIRSLSRTIHLFAWKKNESGKNLVSGKLPVSNLTKCS